ncbi:hypothetical protein DSO57_1005532 [Entomophthora muscae]|uniref:Uncharacterized protein n=1 Tax=Entomophthora muscae TaxID=34485 RepID=A0ACC2TIU6_9FUNG|nr:hypothetical protein DSO57_1005532 [Entomophthora muscae]
MLQKYSKYVFELKISAPLGKPCEFRALTSLDIKITKDNYPRLLDFCTGLRCLVRLKVSGMLDARVVRGFNPIFKRLTYLGIGEFEELQNVGELISCIACHKLEVFTLFHFPIENYVLDELSSRFPQIRLINSVSPRDDPHRMYTLSYCTRKRHLVFAEAKYPTLGLEVCFQAESSWTEQVGRASETSLVHDQGMYMESEMFIMYTLYCAAYCGPEDPNSAEMDIHSRNFVFFAQAIQRLAKVRCLRLRYGNSFGSEVIKLYETSFLATTICIDLGPTDPNQYFLWVAIHFPNLQVFYYPYPHSPTLVHLLFPNLHHFHAQFHHPLSFWTHLVSVAPQLRAVYLSELDESTPQLQALYPNLLILRWCGLAAFELTPTQSI